MENLQDLLLILPAILLALTLHECAHGWMAYRLGDPTARNAGRLTLNPLPHLDPVGTLLLIITTLYHLGSFGWAKPVPVNHLNFSKPRRDTILVSLAGPLSNIALAIIAGVLYKHFAFSMNHFLRDFTSICVAINIGLAFFNLIPIPPLDGSHVLIGFLPRQFIPRYLNATRYVPIAFLLLIVAEQVLRLPLLSYVLDPLYVPFKAVCLLVINLF